MDCIREKNLTEDGILPEWDIVIFLYWWGDSIAWKLKSASWCLAFEYLL